MKYWNFLRNQISANPETLVPPNNMVEIPRSSLSMDGIGLGSVEEEVGSVELVCGSVVVVSIVSVVVSSDGIVTDGSHIMNWN